MSKHVKLHQAIEKLKSLEELSLCLLNEINNFESEASEDCNEDIPSLVTVLSTGSTRIEIYYKNIEKNLNDIREALFEGGDKKVVSK